MTEENEVRPGSFQEAVERIAATNTDTNKARAIAAFAARRATTTKYRESIPFRNVEDVTLPWDDPTHDVMQDIRDAKAEIFQEGNKVKLADMNTLEQVMEAHDLVDKPDCVAIVSGGLDSTTLVYHLLATGYTPHLISFNYGQRHKKELQFAAITAKNLGLRHDVVDLTGITHLISNSALTSQTGLTVRGMNFDGEKFIDNIEVPDGHYAEETMKQTVVPNRNMIMLSIAAGIAVNNKYKFIATGVHAGDHFIYPDCRPEFIMNAAKAIWDGNDGFHNFQWTATPFIGVINAPFINWSKADIAYRAIELGVPLHLTWSCYKGNDKHCGRCGTCVERLEAIDEATKRINIESQSYGPIDRTDYEDTEFWKQAVREAKQ